jgi:DNA-binding NarL/FixJ family response regulator
MIGVLLVDDHAVFRSSVRLRLEQQDGIAPVGEAGTVEKAVARARVLKPDVVVIDLRPPAQERLPDDPRDLERVPGDSNPRLVVPDRPTPVRQAISAGAHGYVPKRATDTEVVDAIRRDAHRDGERREAHAAVVDDRQQQVILDLPLPQATTRPHCPHNTQERTTIDKRSNTGAVERLGRSISVVRV